MHGWSGVNVCTRTFPPLSPRPARPATCASNWNVRSALRKSGRCMPTSAFTTPTSVTFGKSSPLAIICVPSRMWISPRRKAPSTLAWLPGRRIVSLSMRRMTYHRQRGVNLCHYCGYEQTPPELCPQCGQGAVHYQGLGTEKLQAEIEEKFPGHVIRRMDSDTMRRPGSHAKVLAAFRRGEIHIL